MNNDIASLERFLSHPRDCNAMWGFDAMSAKTPILQTDPHEKAMAAAGPLDRLLRLCDALSLIDVFNKENAAEVDQQIARITVYTPEKTDQLIDKLIEYFAKRTSSPLWFPNPFAGEYGLKTERGILSPRAIFDLYLAIRINDLCGSTPKILQIGQGTGRSVYFQFLLGFSSYCLIDLPIPTMVSTYFNGLNIPPEEIWLYGEEFSGQRISFLPANDISAATGRRFEIGVNVDSFVEMSGDIQHRYLDLIRETSQFFLSIQRESKSENETVSKLVYQDLGVPRRYRFPYWLRNGYVEELYEFA